MTMGAVLRDSRMKWYVLNYLSSVHSHQFQEKRLSGPGSNEEYPENPSSESMVRY